MTTNMNDTAAGPPTLPQDSYAGTLARKNCSGLFYIFMIEAIGWVISAPAALLGLKIIPHMVIWFGSFGLIAAIFAAIYLPLRWRTIRLLPKKVRRRGLIGGLGLLGLVPVQLVGTRLLANS